jgi:hypothetical protein
VLATGGLLVIDGYQTVAGDRILVKDHGALQDQAYGFNGGLAAAHDGGRDATGVMHERVVAFRARRRRVARPVVLRRAVGVAVGEQRLGRHLASDLSVVCRVEVVLLVATPRSCRAG